jgi:hypothetical protein
MSTALPCRMARPFIYRRCPPRLQEVSHARKPSQLLAASLPVNSPSLVESAHLTQLCDGLVVMDGFVFDGGVRSDGGVASLSVVEDFEVLEECIGEFDAGASSFPV